MFTRPNPSWIAGTLELASKVRYGLTSRGAPLYRFLPYDKELPPMAVGCSARNLMYHVTAIVEPLSSSTSAGTTLPRGNLIKSDISEQDILLTTYAYDSQKALRTCNFTEKLRFDDTTPRTTVDLGFTFHVDPENCLDVDDAFTVEIKSDGKAEIWIHIADVSAWIEKESPLDIEAYQRATSFYTPNGEAIAPMLPRSLSEEAASLGVSTSFKPALSLRLTWNGKEIQNISWETTMIRCQQRFSYESFDASKTKKEIQVLYEIASVLQKRTVDDSHDVIAAFMILYNTKAGELLKEREVGILRRHAPAKTQTLSALQKYLLKYPGLRTMMFEAAEYCLPIDTNTVHSGLEKEAYAYASSPLRRYADLVNQRAIKAILSGQTAKLVSAELIFQLNRREKQAKAFQRDWFFSNALLQKCNTGSTLSVRGFVLSERNDKGRVKVYVEEWKRCIHVRTLTNHLKEGTDVNISWFEDRTQPRWKERIVFSATADYDEDAHSCATSSSSNS